MILRTGLVGVVLVAGCSSDSKPTVVDGTGGAGGTRADASDAATSGGGASPEAGLGSPPVAFNGDCSTAKWANVSDECWSCLCGACTADLNLCNQDCTGILECATSNHTLVNVSSDISCEIAATTATCLKDPKSQAAASPLLTFDTCLLSASTTKAPGEFRACDTICKTLYTGDVCTRFPPAKM